MPPARVDEASKKFLRFIVISIEVVLVIASACHCTVAEATLDEALAEPPEFNVTKAK